jgi:hypothetical protein
MRVTVVALVVCLAGAARAQTAAPGSAKPSALEETVAAWNEAARKIVAMAEDFPEAKYDFKPTPEVRSFAEQILHVAGGNVQFLEASKGTKPKEEDPPRAQYKTKAQIVAFLKKTVADDVAYLKQKGDAGMAQPMKSVWSGKMVSPMAFWMGAASHMSEHYGQLVFYYRLNKLVPPESRPRK